MARGKYLSLEEARKMKGGLEKFAKEHPSKGDEKRFDRCLELMASGKIEEEARTSIRGASEDYAGTHAPKGTSEDAS